jgi:hypothetical protein
MSDKPRLIPLRGLRGNNKRRPVILRPSKIPALELEFKAGHLPALFEAVRHCHENGTLPTEWMVLAILNLIVDRFNAGHDRRKRRSRYLNDYVHFLRWRALKAEFESHGIDYNVKRRGRRKADAGYIINAQRGAAEALKDGPARATPREILKSFDLVEAAKRSGNAARFQFTHLGN